MDENSTSLKGVALLSFSFVLVLFSASLMGFCDRLLLAHFSIEGLEAGMTALWLTQLFHLPIIRVASTTQAFVAQYKGSEKFNLIGPCVWQAIWLSLMTVVITLPLAGPVGAFFFDNTALQEGKTCFNYLMAFNFLFPLGAALSTFYLGQGQAKRVIKVSLLSHGLHLLLDFPLIFGVQGFIPPLGPLGSIIAALIAQLFFCIALFLDFTHSKYQLYATRDYFFKPAVFWNFIRVGIPRGVAKFIPLASWVFSTRIMVSKGADYAAILAFGGTLQLFLNCFNDSLGQALITLGGYLIGAQKLFVRKLIQTAALFLSLEWCVLAIPLLFFPDVVIRLFFKEEPTVALQTSLIATCGFIWIFFLLEGLNNIGFGLISAYGDTVFQMYFSMPGWVTALPLTYFLIYQGNWAPEWFWLFSATSCLLAASIYFARLLLRKQVNRIQSF